MTTLLLFTTIGWQPPTSSPPAPPAEANRKVPPPIPQPPSVQNPAPQVAPPGGANNAGVNAPLPIAPTPIVVRHVFLRQHDINGDGRLEPGELERRFMRHFAAADTNGDGFLDANEILHDRQAIGKAARRLEGLDLDQEGRLTLRGERRPLPIGDIARGVVGAIDAGKSAAAEGRGIHISVSADRRPNDANAPSAAPTRPVTPLIGPSPAIPPPPSIPSAPTINQAPQRPSAVLPHSNIPATGQGGASAGAAKNDDLPTADQIIANLDKDGDGQLSESEAVDQLARNFKLLDQNKDGKLSKAEIERGLRLSRLFGIKPMQPPKSYRNDAASTPTNPPK